MASAATTTAAAASSTDIANHGDDSSTSNHREDPSGDEEDCCLNRNGREMVASTTEPSSGPLVDVADTTRPASAAAAVVRTETNTKSEASRNHQLSSSAAMNRVVDVVPSTADRIRCTICFRSDGINHKRDDDNSSVFYFRPDDTKKSVYWLDNDDDEEVRQHVPSEKGENGDDNDERTNQRPTRILHLYDDGDNKVTDNGIKEPPPTTPTPKTAECWCIIDRPCGEDYENDEMDNTSSQTNQSKQQSLLFMVGGFQLTSNAKSVEIYLQKENPSNPEQQSLEYLMTCRGIRAVGQDSKKGGDNSDNAAIINDERYKILCVIPGGPKPVYKVHLKFVNLQPMTTAKTNASSSSSPATHPNLTATASARIVSMKLTARIPQTNNDVNAISNFNRHNNNGRVESMPESRSFQPSQSFLPFPNHGNGNDTSIGINAIRNPNANSNNISDNTMMNTMMQMMGNGPMPSLSSPSLQQQQQHQSALDGLLSPPSNDNRIYQILASEQAQAEQQQAVVASASFLTRNRGSSVPILSSDDGGSTSIPFRATDPTGNGVQMEMNQYHNQQRRFDGIDARLTQLTATVLSQTRILEEQNHLLRQQKQHIMQMQQRMSDLMAFQQQQQQQLWQYQQYQQQQQQMHASMITQQLQKQQVELKEMIRARLGDQQHCGCCRCGSDCGCAQERSRSTDKYHGEHDRQTFASRRIPTDLPPRPPPDGNADETNAQHNSLLIDTTCDKELSRRNSW